VSPLDPNFSLRVRGAVGIALGALLLASCNSLDVENPNAPDATRALADPAAIEAVAGGTLRTWFNTWDGMEGGGPLVTMAQTYSASWNNFNMNFYSSIDGDGTRNSRPFQNDLASAGRTTMIAYWEGYYSTLSSAVDVLTAIRKNNLVIGNASNTKRAETIAQLMRGAALMGIALNYDKGYVIDENTDLAGLAYKTRKEVRDAAVAAFANAATLAAANQFTTPSAWTNGTAYTNTQIAALARTMAAMTLAYYPRTADENAQVDWNAVAQLASQGISSGTNRFDFIFTGDGCNSWCHEMLYWFNAFDGGRVSTRVAALLDPATQRHPYPAGGNPRPNSPDKRLGDGSFGPDDGDFAGYFGTIPKTARGGTDFVYSTEEIFRPDRGMYHQSNIGHIRYDRSGEQSPNGIYGGFGPAPVITRHQNDLVWAEAELRRSGGNLATAANLINNTRVDRGGLTPATAGEGQASLLQKLIYEQEVELLGLGAAPFYQRRRVANGLLTGTPREMPVPAKELGVKGDAFYTFGGASNPANSPTPP
jgi:hypothetical protein